MNKEFQKLKDLLYNEIRECIILEIKNMKNPLHLHT